MKKLISLTLALLLVFSLATVASAESNVQDVVETEATSDSTFYFKKQYSDGTVNEEGKPNLTTVYPAEELSFSIDGNDVTGAPQISIATGQTIASNPDEIAITVGEATAPGVYEYTITEETGNTLGVSYDNSPINVTVWVYYKDVPVAGGAEGEVSRVLMKSVTFTKPETGNKIDTITNTYTLHDLSIKKVVSGSLGEQDPSKQKFKISVTFTVPEGKTAKSSISWSVAGVPQADITADQLNAGYKAEFEIGHEQTVTFNNIPDGILYTILEDASHTLEHGETFDPNDTSSGYTATYTTDQQTMTADSEQTITNNKDQDVETGITLDSIPFILILAVCAGAVVLFVVKRRRSVDF